MISIEKRNNSLEIPRRNRNDFSSISYIYESSGLISARAGAPDQPNKCALRCTRSYSKNIRLLGKLLLFRNNITGKRKAAAQDVIIS